MGAKVAVDLTGRVCCKQAATTALCNCENFGADGGFTVPPSAYLDLDSPPAKPWRNDLGRVYEAKDRLQRRNVAEGR